MIQPRFPPATNDTRDNRLTTQQPTHNRPMKKWQPSLDKRPKADDVYQRRIFNDEKAMGNARQLNGSRFSPLAEINDEQTMNWQPDTMRQVEDAKEMETNHLDDDSTSHSTIDQRLSIKNMQNRVVLKFQKLKNMQLKQKFTFSVPLYT